MDNFFFFFFLLFIIIGNGSAQPNIYISQNRTLSTIDINIPHDHEHDITYLLTIVKIILETISNELSNLNIRCGKLHVFMTLLMHRNIPHISNDEMPEISNFHIQSSVNLYAKREIDDFICDICNTINDRLENSQNQLQGSGWVIQEISGF